jgi:hypothetical protein
MQKEAHNKGEKIWLFVMKILVLVSEISAMNLARHLRIYKPRDLYR